MKKISLLLLLVAFMFTAKAVNFPSSWDIASTIWSGYAVAPPGFERKSAEALYYEEPIDVYSIDFFEEWEKIPESYEYPFVNAVMMNNAQPKSGDGTGSFKVAYDSDGITVFGRYIDDENPTGKERLEIAYSPYHKLGENGRNFTNVEGEDRSGVLYTRYWELGASKLTILRGGVEGIMQLSGATKSAGDLSKDLVAKFWVDFANFTDDTFQPKDLCFVAKLPYDALKDDFYNTEFNESVWPALNDGKGLSFDVKFVDVDQDLLIAGGSRDYWWNANVNDGFWSTDFSGFLKQGPNIDDVSIEDAALQSGIIITASQIELQEVADVQIFTASGLLVKSAANVTVVPTDDLQAGAYIVVAGNKVAKFVK